MEEFDPEELPSTSPAKEPVLSPIRTFSTNCAHYWESRGIQETGEQVVKCRDCPLGMEVDPEIRVIDGIIQWN